jgi:hypothetical protein
LENENDLSLVAQQDSALILFDLPKI